MKSFPIWMVVLILLFTLTYQQIKFPLEYTKEQTQQSNTNTRHHLLREGTATSHRITSRLSHNLKFIQSHFNKAQNHLSHHLTVQPADHLRLQTFNLLPNTYSFSLPMKIAGYNYKMSIDSGSSDIFIKGEDSKGKPKKRYHCGQICIDTHEHYQIGYLDGKLQTYEATLEVEVGQHKFNESILVAYKVEHNFEENQGLVGLSFPELASNPNPSFLQTLKNQKIIDVYAFGVNLNFQNKSRSFITFGSYDNQFFQGQLDMIPLTSKLFYYVASEGASIGDGQLLPISRALFDTGNTCISIPKKYESDILKQFNKGEGEKRNECFFSVEKHAEMFSVIRCKVGDFDALPALNVHINGKKYPIEKEYYIQACDRRPRDQNFNGSDSSGVWYCDLYVESVSGMKELFLGDGFFNRYYTYFNIEDKKIGIAKNKEVIPIKRLIDNQLDATAQDWIDIIKTLNPDESDNDIRKQIQEAVKRSQTKDKKKKSK